ncbi:hypothetical protein P7K49_019146 [Saguinus oedipus]|uniref:Uncharacterized protein n=1 Tax=Saguinus oedipus TaxID=9490 RepID=A0ABQ9UWP0_SAGOE|nr:hypothetical protein P7K49_019146 [Saguinus oedipus]
MGEESAGWSERAIQRQQRNGEKDTAKSPTSPDRAAFVFLMQRTQQQTKAPGEKAKTLVKLGPQDIVKTTQGSSEPERGQMLDRKQRKRQRGNYKKDDAKNWMERRESKDACCVSRDSSCGFPARVPSEPELPNPKPFTIRHVPCVTHVPQPH